MRRVFPILPGDAEGVSGRLGCLRKLPQFFTCLDARPQNARGACVRKPANTADADLNGAGRGDAQESALNILQAIFRPLADELRGDVQIVDASPVQLCRRTQAFEQAPQVALDIIIRVILCVILGTRGDFNRCEQAHGNLLVYAKCSSKAPRVLYTVSLGITMKKLATLLMMCAVCLWAADFWQAKPFTEWTDKDV